MKKLYFDNPTFKRGQYLTCRRGLQWALPIESTSDYDFEIKDLDNDSTIGYGNITRQLPISFKDITDQDLVFEHDYE